MIGSVSRYLGVDRSGRDESYEGAVEKLERFGQLTEGAEYRNQAQVETQLVVETSEGPRSLETGGIKAVSDRLEDGSPDRRHVIGSDLESVSSWLDRSEIQSGSVRTSGSGFGLIDIRNMRYDDLRIKADFSGEAGDNFYFRGAPVVDQGEEFRLEYEASIPGKTGWENTQLREFIENF